MPKRMTPFTHPRVVLAHLQTLNSILIPSLEYCCGRSAQYFHDQNLPYDAGLHSYLTRHRLLHILRRKSISAVAEQDGADYSTEGQSLCGIRIETEECILKLLKHPSRKCELPSVTTEQRRDFCQANLDLGDLVDVDEDQKLHLLELWDADNEHRLSYFAVACPYGVKDSRPLKKWWQTLDVNAFGPLEDPEPVADEPELDEITPRYLAIDTETGIPAQTSVLDGEDQQDEDTTHPRQ